MTRTEVEPSPFLIPEMVRPDAAMSLDQIIDQRFKDLLTMGLEPKHLTDALKAATEWYKVKQLAEAGDGYGAKLGRGTMRGSDGE